MNKYDFDFKRIEDELYSILGIVNPTDILSLKMQIRANLDALTSAIDKKAINPNSSKIIMNKNAIHRELDSIAKETDLDVILERLVDLRSLTLLGLEEKIRFNDTYDEQQRKRNRQSEIRAITDLVRCVPSIQKLIKNRELLLDYIDSKDRIIKYNKVQESVPVKYNIENTCYPSMQLNIKFQQRPRSFSGEQGKVLEESGIYAYDFGEVTYSAFLNEEVGDTQELSKKNLVGVIKKDEFGKLRKYSVLMNLEDSELPPEFLRDILFSDMLLRNARNNLNYLGNVEKNPNDSCYGYIVTFHDFGLEDMLRAIYFEANTDRVLVKSNFSRVRNVSDAYALMQDKMEQTLREIELSNINLEEKAICEV